MAQSALFKPPRFSTMRVRVLSGLALAAGTLWLHDMHEAGWLMAMLFWVHVMVPAVILAWRDRAEEE